MINLKTENGIEQLKKENESKIFVYLKAQPSILISVISGFVIIITFILNCVIYIKEYGRLQSWGIDAKYVQIDNVNQIYMLAGVSIIFLINIIFLQIMFATYDKYLENIKRVITNEVIEKEIKKDIRRKKLKKLLPIYKLEDWEKEFLSK